jgi:hypothetical protein
MRRRDEDAVADPAPVHVGMRAYQRVVAIWAAKWLGRGHGVLHDV